MAQSKKSSTKRKGHDLASIIMAYVKEHPEAQYFEVLASLNSRGYRINRHGSGKLIGLYNAARKTVK